jgi:CBS domain-containing protein
MAHDPTTSMADTLRRVRALLASLPLSAALDATRERQTSLVTLYDGQSLSSALHTLASWRVTSAPVLAGSPPWLKAPAFDVPAKEEMEEEKETSDEGFAARTARVEAAASDAPKAEKEASIAFFRLYGHWPKTAPEKRLATSLISEDTGVAPEEAQPETDPFSEASVMTRALAGRSSDDESPFPHMADVVGFLTMPKVVAALVSTAEGVDPADARAVRAALSGLWELKLCEIFDLDTLAADWGVVGDEDTSGWSVHGVPLKDRSLLEIITAGFLGVSSSAIETDAATEAGVHPFALAANAHRIAVWAHEAADVSEPGWSSADSPYDATLVGVFSESDAVDLLYRLATSGDDSGVTFMTKPGLTDADCLRDLARCSLDNLGLGAPPPGGIFTVSADEPLLSAFRGIRSSGFSIAGVVDETGSLIAAISASDVQALLPSDAASALTLTVAAYLESLGRIRYYSHSGLAAKGGDAQAIIHQQRRLAALRFGAHIRSLDQSFVSAAPLSPFGDVATGTVEGGESEAVGALPREERGSCAVAVKKGSSLLDVLGLMARGAWGGYHAVFVVDEEGKASGVVSLTDVLRLVAGC